jgi:hypothetical protein
MVHVEFTYDSIIIDGDIRFKLQDVIKNCNRQGVIKDDLVILQIEWEATRNSPWIYEYIVFPRQDAQDIKEFLLSGINICFDEIYGKHSYVSGTFIDNDFRIIDNIDKVTGFISKYSDKWTYNHSFLVKILEEYAKEDIKPEFQQTFEKLSKFIYGE